MKKGCFIKLVIMVTIIVAVSVYIIQYKIEDWMHPGKKLILTTLLENWETEAAYIKNSAEKDSLKSLIKYYQDYINSGKEVVNLDADVLLNRFEEIIEDSIVTENELSQLTKELNKEQNEKSESNRN